MRNFRHIFFLLLLCAQVSGCHIGPELHLRQSIATEIMLEAQVNVNLVWETEWEAHWVFPWSESAFGEMGYQEPSSMSVHIYPLDANGEHKAHSVQHFYGTSTEMPISAGMHDLLFHNNDSESLIFTTKDEIKDDIYCTTRVISSGLKASDPVMTPLQKSTSETKASKDSSYKQDPVSLMPDALFVLYDQREIISDNLEDYEYIDGRYVYRIEGELEPASYIHLIQIHLLNNQGRVVGSNSGAVITGVAAGVDLQTRIATTTSVSVPMDMHFDRKTDIMAARAITFGIPGCDPLDAESLTKAPESVHFLIINMCYSNNSWKNIRVDITDAFRAHPKGGVIDLALDVNDFPPESAKTDGNGGFNALIDEWEEEEGGITIVY